jgi:co-chaperonin GroES (HSP10)
MSTNLITVGRSILAATLLACTVGLLGACSVSSETAGTGHSPATDPTRSAAKASCSSDAILAALPGGATMRRFDCAKVGDTEWAAAQVNPGDTVFFLQWNGRAWDAEDSDSVCGTASAGLPAKLLAYCEPAASSSSTSPTATAPNTPVTQACTAEAILAAVPDGATMKRFTCADVDGELWAAARVDPGDTTFFLQWNGTAWNAEDSDSVCGTASAGLPAKLLTYCK